MTVESLTERIENVSACISELYSDKYPYSTDIDKRAAAEAALLAEGFSTAAVRKATTGTQVKPAVLAYLDAWRESAGLEPFDPLDVVDWSGTPWDVVSNIRDNYPNIQAPQGRRAALPVRGASIVARMAEHGWVDREKELWHSSMYRPDDPGTVLVVGSKGNMLVWEVEKSGQFDDPSLLESWDGLTIEEKATIVESTPEWALPGPDDGVAIARTMGHLHGFQGHHVVEILREVAELFGHKAVRKCGGSPQALKSYFFPFLDGARAGGADIPVGTANVDWSPSAEGLFTSIREMWPWIQNGNPAWCRIPIPGDSAVDRLQRNGWEFRKRGARFDTLADSKGNLVDVHPKGAIRARKPENGVLE